MGLRTSKEQQLWVYRTVILVAIAVIVPLGLASKIYRGIGDTWVRDYSGDILYEIFWILLLAWMAPRANLGWIAVSVFGVTALIEVLQLWHPPFLTAIRTTLPGRLLLGTQFVWWDFFYYFLGCCLGCLGLRYARSKILQN